MTRVKKSRKVNANQPRQQDRAKQKNPQQGKKKGKGLASGTRHSEAAKQTRQKSRQSAADPRLGSKKAIPLLLPTEKPVTPAAKPISLPPAQELERLETDPRLEQLLDRVEQDLPLPADDQQWLDEQLDRIEALMEELGINDEPETLGADDDDLLKRFQGDIDDLKALDPSQK